MHLTHGPLLHTLCTHTDAATVDVLDLYGTVLVAVDPAARRRRGTPGRRWLALRHEHALQGLGASADGQEQRARALVTAAGGAPARRRCHQPRHVLLDRQGQSCCGTTTHRGDPGGEVFWVIFTRG